MLYTGAHDCGNGVTGAEALDLVKPMTDENTPALEGGALHQFLFRKSIPLQLRFQEVKRAVGDPDGMTCLEMGNDNGAFSFQLRRLGGDWHTVVRDTTTAAAVQELVATDVHVFDGKALPFAAKSFDLVVVGGGMEQATDETTFIELFHRILKPDGRVVVCVQRLKPFSLLNPLRHMLTPSDQDRDRRRIGREGYTEGELFRALKDGFDVHTMRSYSRIFVELVDLLTASTLARHGGKPDDATLARVHRRAYPFAWLAFQLDLLMFFTRGHRLVATAKRRAWLPRKTPILIDGRSISEAVLSSAVT